MPRLFFTRRFWCRAYRRAAPFVAFDPTAGTDLGDAAETKIEKARKETRRWTARLIPIGYTKEMNEYMTAADLIVGNQAA
jgi:hypothetical protein